MTEQSEPNTTTLSSTAYAAFGKWHAAEFGITYFQQAFCAVQFVLECIAPGTDVLEFLVPLETKHTRKKSTTQLTDDVRPKFTPQESFLIKECLRAMDLETITRKKKTPHLIFTLASTLQRRTRMMLKVYHYMARYLQVCTPARCKMVDEQLRLQFKTDDIKGMDQLEHLFQMLDPQKMKQLYEEGYFESDGLEYKIHYTRFYMKKLREQKVAADAATDSAGTPTATVNASPNTDRPDHGSIAEALARHTEGTAQQPATACNATPRDSPSIFSGNGTDYEPDNHSEESEESSDASVEYMPLHEATVRLPDLRYRQRRQEKKRKGQAPPKPPRAKPPAKKKQRRKGTEDSHYIDSKTDESAAGAGADLNSPPPGRRVFDHSWLFLEPTGQHMCFELPIHGREGTKSTSGSILEVPTSPNKRKADDIAQDDPTTQSVTAGADEASDTENARKRIKLHDQDILAEFHDMVVTAMSVYMFNDSKIIYHEELEEEQSRTVMETCFREGIGYTRHPTTRSSVHSNFFKVAPYGTPELEELTKDLEFDAPLVIDTMKQLLDDNDPSVEASDDDERNTIHFDGGLGGQPYNHMAQPEDTELTASYPVFVNEPRDDKPEEYQILYEQVGPILDICQDFVDKRGGENGQRPMGDPFHTQKAGAEVRKKCKAKRSRFEAFTIGITKLGTKQEYDANQKKFPNKEHTVGWHQDGENGIRPGYKWTCVFGVIVVVGNMVYRLAVIAYTRKSVGDSLEHETTLGQFTDMLRQWFSERPDVWDLDYSTLERKETLKYHATDREDAQCEEDGKACKSLADPVANYSAVLDALHQLADARNHLPRQFWVELLIAIQRHNSPTMLRNLILSWLPNKGASTRLFEEGLDKGYGPHTLLLRECERRDIHISNGRFPRFQWSMGHDSNWPDQRNGEEIAEQIRQDVQTMDKVLSDADNVDFPHRLIIDRIRKIKHIGPVKVLSFYMIAVHAGFLTSNHAVRESHDAILHEDNPGAQELQDQGFYNLDMALRRLSWKLNTTHKIIENSLCKKYRHENFCWDFFAEDQRLYCSKREMNGKNQELTRFY